MHQGHLARPVAGAEAVTTEGDRFAGIDRGGRLGDGGRGSVGGEGGLGVRRGREGAPHVQGSGCGQDDAGGGREGHGVAVAPEGLRRRPGPVGAAHVAHHQVGSDPRRQRAAGSDGVQELAERDAGRGQLVHRQFRALAGTGQREEPIGRAGRRIDGPPGLGRKRLACRGCDAGGPGVAILNHVWPQSPATARALSSLARADAVSRRPNPCPLADCAHGASCSCASP